MTYIGPYIPCTTCATPVPTISFVDLTDDGRLFNCLACMIKELKE